MQTGSAKYWTWFLTGFLTFVLVGVINLFLDDIPGSWDLTEDKRYTLPEAAETIASRLEDTCNIQVILSDPLPSYLDHIPRALRNRLEEFKEASNDRITFEFIAPEEESDEYVKDLEERKIQPANLPDFVQGKRVTGHYYMWLIMQYADQEENFHLLELRQALIKEAEFRRMLPFQIAAKLVKMMNPDRQVGILSEKKIPPPQLQQAFGKDATDGLKTVRQRIESHLKKPLDVNIKAGNPVPENIDTLIVFRPDNLDARAVYDIDQHLMKGKNVVILLDNHATIDVDRIATDYVAGFQSGKLKVRPLRHGLTEWLAYYGIEVQPGWVESLQHCVQVGTAPKVVNGRLVGFEKVTVHYPGLVLVREFDKDKDPTGLFNDESPVMAGLGAFCAAWPVPMELNADAVSQAGDLSAEVVIWTGEDSFVRDGKGDVMQIRYRDEADYDTPSGRKSYPLVVSVGGKFKSFYAGKEYGEGETKTDRPPRLNANGEPLPALPSETPRLDESIGSGRLWVFADSDFASDYTYLQLQRLVGPAGFSPDARTGLVLAMTGLVNAVDTLTVGGELVEIRKPNLKDRALDEKRIDEDKSSIRWQTVFLAPIVLIVLGIIWGIIRWTITRVPSPLITTPENQYEPPSDPNAPAKPEEVAAQPEGQPS